MDLHTLARGSGLVGGLCWLARFVLDLNRSGSDTLHDLLHGAGLVLLALALVAAGAGLVNRSAVWLRAIVGIAFPLLVWSVLEVLHPAGDEVAVDGVFGGLVALVALVALVRGRRRRERRTRSVGAHAR
jgi:MYXO-CTERM domain-containing protein